MEVKEKNVVLLGMASVKKAISLLTVLAVLTGLLLSCASGAQGSTPGRNAKEVTGYDVVIIGGGGTGLTAALVAADAGSKVLLLEKMGFLGGATVLASGFIPASQTKQQSDAGIVDTPEALARDIFRPGMYEQNYDLVMRIARGAKDYIEWSTAKGVKWSLQTNVLYYGQSNYRIHESTGMGKGIVDALEASIKNNNNITVMLETAGTGLWTDSTGAVIGCMAKNKNEELAIRARSVVLGTSGFAANKEMVRKYIPVMEHAIPYYAPGATGEGILWGMALGAAVKHMDAYQAYGACSSKTKKGIGQGIINAGGILLNKDSARFMMEITGYSELGAQIVSQPGYNAWMIWDSGVAAVSQNTMNTLKEGAALFEAPTPEELARAIGLDENKVKAEIDKYRDGIAKGEDYMNRTKLPKSFNAPFYACQVTGDFRHTQGGLVVNENSQVVKEDGTLIPNLYAGGGVTEGFSSAGGAGYMSGNGLLQAFVLGHIAGQSAAKNAK